MNQLKFFKERFSAVKMQDVGVRHLKIPTFHHSCFLMISYAGIIHTKYVSSSSGDLTCFKVTSGDCRFTEFLLLMAVRSPVTKSNDIKFYKTSVGNKTILRRGRLIFFSGTDPTDPNFRQIKIAIILISRINTSFIFTFYTSSNMIFFF